MHFLTIQDAARKLCCSQRTLRNMIAEGTIPTVLIGHRHRLEMGKLNEWVGQGGATARKERK